MAAERAEVNMLGVRRIFDVQFLVLNILACIEEHLGSIAVCNLSYLIEGGLIARDVGHGSHDQKFNLTRILFKGLLDFLQDN